MQLMKIIARFLDIAYLGGNSFLKRNCYVCLVLDWKCRFCEADSAALMNLITELPFFRSRKESQHVVVLPAN